MSLEIYIIVVVVLCILSTMFSMSDMAISSVNVLRLKKEAEEGNWLSKHTLNLAVKYDDTISTILFCNNVTNIGISSIMVTLIASMSLPNETVENIISIIISTFILLLIGEVIPKQIAKVYNYRLAKFFTLFVLFFKYLCYPITFVFTKIAFLLSKLFIKGTKNIDVETEVSDELQEMVDTIEDEGIIDEEKAELIRSAIEFNETEAYEVMTPRVDVLMFDIHDDIQKLIDDKSYFNYSRIPVYEDDRDDIIGILPLKLLQRKILTNSKIDVHELMYKPAFVPRSAKITDVLTLFKETKHHMAIVLDEYGGVEGIISIEDIIEELVGPIFDETDKVEKEYSKTKNGYIISGSMNIDDFFDLVEIEPEFDDPSFNTVSGWVVDNLNRFAQVGDTFNFKNLTIKVLNIDDFIVNKIEVIINKEENSED